MDGLGWAEFGVKGWNTGGKINLVVCGRYNELDRAGLAELGTK